MIFIILAFIAEILGTIGGFGSSMLFVPLASFFYPFKTVLAITALFHVFSNISKLWLFRKGFNKKLLLQIGLPSVVFVIIGSALSAYIDLNKASLFLGLFLVGYSLFFLLKESAVVKPLPINAIAMGSLSGFLAGLIGTGGAVRGAALAAFNIEKEIFVATSAAIDFGVDLSRSVVYFNNGFFKEFDYSLWIIALALVGVAWFGSLVGKYFLEKISQNKFRKISLALIFLVGIITVGEYFL